MLNHIILQLNLFVFGACSGIFLYIQLFDIETLSDYCLTPI